MEMTRVQLLNATKVAASYGVTVEAAHATLSIVSDWNVANKRDGYSYAAFCGQFLTMTDDEIIAVMELKRKSQKRTAGARALVRKYGVAIASRIAGHALQG